MSDEGTPPDLHRIASRSEFAAAVRDAITAAADAASAELYFVDPDFDGWPIDEKDVVEVLTRWAGSNRSLTLVGGSFDALARRAPRFAAWRRNWSHLVSCRAIVDIDAGQVPTLLLVPGAVAVRLDDRLRHRGTVSARPIEQIAARESIDALLQRSIESFPATTLGL